jgi:tRNA threonylcarbamoyladenosine biosynthesis protein TsaE
MESLGARLADACTPGLLILLQGVLGAGKTTLVRGALRAWGYKGPVKSPTYTLVESYAVGQFSIHHFDFFRLSNPDELEYLGLRDYFDGRSICFAEWPERVKGLLPTADVQVDLRFQDHGRRVDVVPTSNAGRLLLRGLDVKGIEST